MGKPNPEIEVLVIIRDGTVEAWANAKVTEERLQSDAKAFALEYLWPAFLAARRSRKRLLEKAEEAS